MKKTLLATAIVSAIAALGATSSVQAATVYDQDGTKLDVYGRIAMGIRGGGPEFSGTQEIDNGAEFVDVYSRLGLRMSHAISSDLTAFGRVEWRFDGDERTGPSGNGNTGFKEVRQSYIGLQSDQFGTFQAGNFDAFYNQFVSLPFDVYIDRGFEFAGHPTQSRGDSIGYYTPDLSGFTVFLQGKHYSSRGEFEPNDGSEVAAQGGVRYAQGPVTVGLGFIDDIEEGNGNDEVRYGLIGSYDFTDQFSARLGYETRDDNDVLGGGFDTAGLGGTFTTGPWAFAVDYYNIDRDNNDDSNAWAAGSYYKVSSNFDVFLELADGDAPTVNRDTTLGDLTDEVYWLTGARYHF
ncbi:porin [Vreelandella neptunia]|uniref:Porin n=1 Tax=Vreelandella neptunia TaxID=115551 RepID=A0ABZ0YQE1_9GAMM|nr:porin [Halomonas neptunia]MDN3559236.1 porin [Halomonas neptunia]WQH14196.1 porin [Halomonas neptunia]